MLLRPTSWQYKASLSVDPTEGPHRVARRSRATMPRAYWISFGHLPAHALPSTITFTGYMFMNAPNSQSRLRCGCIDSDTPREEKRVAALSNFCRVFQVSISTLARRKSEFSVWRASECAYATACASHEDLTRSFLSDGLCAPGGNRRSKSVTDLTERAPIHGTRVVKYRSDIPQDAAGLLSPQLRGMSILTMILTVDWMTGIRDAHHPPMGTSKHGDMLLDSVAWS